MLMYLVGMADDLVGVRYRAKFLAQIIAGVLIVMSGLVVDDLRSVFSFWVFFLCRWLGF